MTYAIIKGLRVVPEKQSIVLKKNATILKLKDRLDHGNYNSYILSVRIFTIPRTPTKHLEVKNLEGTTPMNPEGAEATTANTSIKYKVIVNMEVNEREMEPT